MIDNDIEITVGQLYDLGDDAEILDIRSATDRAYGIIPRSKAFDIETLENDITFSNDKIIVVYCAHGQYSVDVAEKLREKGFRAYSLEGGYREWIRAEMSRIDNEEKVRENVEQSLRKKFRVCLMSRFVKAINDYKLVKDGDSVAVCISGGKDSMLMAKLFQEYHKYSDVKFDLKFLVMDPGYNAENRKIIETNARMLGVPINVFESNIFESVYNVEKSPCYLCARMRRGFLYNSAAIKSRWDTTTTMSSKQSLWACFTAHRFKR